MHSFAKAIITWQKFHGRHNLPWQNTCDPYAIWVSEIMLQQTQVAAVIGYYAKFMLRFPTIEKLANATQEQVLQYWSGLGYYSRARNMHNAAQKIVDDFEGVFPTQFDDILSLPGIGRTTAAAISTFALNTPQPILDGNVKRVFTRHFNIVGYTGAPKVLAKLWQIAMRENPIGVGMNADAISYTQGLMDLGATICTRSKPKCGLCPVNISCIAFNNDLVKTLPTPKPRKVLPEKSVTMLVLINNNQVMLEKRASIGIWGGLWSFPELLNDVNVASYDSNNQRTHHKKEHAQDLENIVLDKLTHTFTHYKLHIYPLLIYSNKNPQVNQSATIWLSISEAVDAAIPTPVRKILIALKTKILEADLNC